MKQYIKIKEDLIELVSCYGANRNIRGSTRDSLEITLNSTYEYVVETFIDDLEYSLVQVDEETQEKQEYDKTEYCISGDIVDHRDGTITIYMGVKTELEYANEVIDMLQQII